VCVSVEPTFNRVTSELSCCKMADFTVGPTRTELYPLSITKSWSISTLHSTAGTAPDASDETPRSPRTNVTARQSHPLIFTIGSAR
jgi:hypothetical protein